MNEDEARARFRAELLEDSRLTDALFDYATRKELDDIRAALLSNEDYRCCRLMRRLWRRVVGYELSKRMNIWKGQ